jgi:hypothetical protein
MSFMAQQEKEAKKAAQTPPEVTDLQTQPEVTDLQTQPEVTDLASWENTEVRETNVKKEANQEGKK